jgi:CheY-like chemotaxis protein
MIQIPSQTASHPRDTPSAFRLLILEDSVTDAELEQHALHKSELMFAAEVVATEQAFVDALRGFGPDIVIVDFQVPGFNGVEAAREVKQWRADIPVILVTRAQRRGRWAIHQGRDQRLGPEGPPHPVACGGTECSGRGGRCARQDSGGIGAG